MVLWSRCQQQNYLSWILLTEGVAVGVTVEVAAVAAGLAFALPDPVFELVVLLGIFRSSFIVMNCFDHNNKFPII